jgi:hypothetical protein
MGSLSVPISSDARRAPGRDAAAARACVAMALWSTTLRLGKDLKLLVTSPEGDDLIKARLPIRPPHPRALLTLLEGIALFSGSTL